MTIIIVIENNGSAKKNEREAFETKEELYRELCSALYEHFSENNLANSRDIFHAAVKLVPRPFNRMAIKLIRDEAYLNGIDSESLLIFDIMLEEYDPLYPH
jgi:hypothetical protein